MHLHLVGPRATTKAPGQVRNRTISSFINSKIEVNQKGEIQMSAAGAAPSLTKRDLETALIEKCWKDPEFKKQIVTDPKGMLERHIGQKLPADLKIVIHEEDANTLHFSLPPAPSNTMELSDEDLEKVAGGTELILVAPIALSIALATAGAVASGVVTAKHGW
jgi:Nitrile hydratase, alpha chain